MRLHWALCCVLWTQCNPSLMSMEGSTGSTDENSGSSRKVSSSDVLERASGLLGAERADISEKAGYGFQCEKEAELNMQVDDDRLRCQVGSSGVCEDEANVNPFFRTFEWGDVSLRQWLDEPERAVDAFECWHIFRQIVEIVNVAHSQGIVIQNVRPSCFVMSSFNHVSFIESASCSDSGSDSIDGGSDSQSLVVKDLSSALLLDMYQCGRPVNKDFRHNALSEGSFLHSSSRHPRTIENECNKMLDRKHLEQVEERKQPFPMKQVLLMETNWYTTPEEAVGTPSTYASDIYRLGVLLFELFCPFGSREEKTRTMTSLRHRVLPPQLLLKWPKEASFCLWLLHPEPNTRPQMSEVLQCEFLNKSMDNLAEREAAIEVRGKIKQQELLLEFLSLIQQRKQEAADRLQNAVSLLCSDIEGVTRQQSVLKKRGTAHTFMAKDDHSMSNVPSVHVINNDESSSSGSRKRYRSGLPSNDIEECNDLPDKNSDQLMENHEKFLLRSSRLMTNFKKLESAYFSTRWKSIKPSARPSTRNSPLITDGRGSISMTDRSSVNNLTSERSAGATENGWINPFLEGLCKYLSFSKLKVKADLKQGDLLSSSNLVCSLGFDRDGEFFATAGVNKKIKVFECDAITNGYHDIHYPVVELASGSKLSSVCWNSYIKSQIASSNFDGVVQLWDVSRGQALMQLKEHDKRVWSVDFSTADPTVLASGSDDGSVKLWSINQGASIGTIRTKANVCCVQFSSDSGRYLAFGSADHRTYYYDLRNSKVPLSTLIGHNKTVSYVKFVEANTLVSASTDNTLKLWDLTASASRLNDTPIQSFTGHANVKNFVGLSVADGYIATGSETNEVYVYHKAFPMPALSFKFNNVDPLSGQDVEDSSQFISSVCWRGGGKPTTLLAANSAGNIKILEMV